MMPSTVRLPFVLLCTCAAITALASIAAGPRPLSTQDESDAMTFTLDPVHCMANFRVQHMGAGMFWGRFNAVSGTIETKDEGRIPLAFDVSIEVDSIDTGTEKLDRTLMSPNFFDEKEFSTITFKSSSLKPIEGRDGAYTVSGDLTLLGTTKPIEAIIERTGVNGNPVMRKAGYEAIFTIKRSDFGMTWGVDNGALGDDVRLVVGLEGDWSA